jgi:ESCRT-II complex subunit VPS36
MKAVESFSSDIDSKYRLRCFSGGGKFVQSCKFNDDEFYEKILKLLNHQDCITSYTVAAQENISIILAKEELLLMESKGLLCRDETIQGILFYPNKF